VTADAGREPREDASRAAPRRVVVLGSLLAAAGAALLVATTAVAANLLDGRGEQLLDARDEESVWTWATSVAAFAGAFAAALHALSFVRLRRELLFVAGTLALFSLDDAAVLHEHAGEALSDALGAPEYVGARAWLLVYPPLLAAAAYALWRVARESYVARRALVAGVALLGAAVALEVLGVGARWLDERGTTWPRSVESVLEEGVELAGWILVASGLAATLLAGLAVPPAEREHPRATL
jgi:hypothetical protein